MKTKFAIGCLIQWYEVDIIEEYIDSLMADEKPNGGQK